MAKYKYGLILDTNVFIHLSQENHYPVYIYETFLRNMIFNPEILFIIPEQVRVEWQRIIAEKEEAFIEQNRKPLLDALKFAKFIENPQQLEDYNKALQQALKIKDRIHKYVFKQRIKIISDFLFKDDFFMKRPRFTVPRSSDVEKLVVDLSLNHSPPFFGDGKGKGKINEMADAIIFFSACEFATSHSDLCDSYFFITDETNFSMGPKLHEEIAGRATEANLGFYCSFKTFIDNQLKEIAEQYRNVKPQNLFLSDEYFKNCDECGGEVHINKDGDWKHSYQGEFWHYQCSCGHEWHEFEDRY
ncbi:hypothetical protein L2D08_06965 [Domibacillus sp. PGB-M46]|uniref:hypothetical protein n=1 Tax=Domibacillus sp. PGB-M46 TaxID=2910255 RepID=UPI001F568DC7|nr:hypothetical protein [Domibacillus sp. PGB-M46]MCI2254102.1 hypothetical protein [Domibacillus sp. PGB-M46]